MIPIPNLQGLAGDTYVYESVRALSEGGVPNDFQLATTAPLLISGTGTTGASVSAVVGGTAILRGRSATVGLQIPLGTQYGGTGSSGPWTAGSVVFIGSTGNFAQDAANFFYDVTNKWLGVGSASPSLDIHVKKTTAGAIGLAVTNLSANAAALAKVEVQSDDAIHGGRMSVTSSGATPARLVRVEAWGTGSDLRLGTVTGDAITVLSSNNNVGIGTTGPSGILSVVSTAANTVPLLTASGTTPSTPSTFQWNLLTNERAVIFAGAASGVSALATLLLGTNAAEASGNFIGNVSFGQAQSGKANPDGYSGLKCGISAQTSGSGGSTAGYGGVLRFWTRADNGAAADAIWIASNQAVAIGSNNPFAGQLHVNKANAGGLGGDLWITNSGANTIGSTARLAFGADGTTDATANAAIENVVTNVGSFLSDLVFKFFDGSGYNEKMRLTHASVLTLTSAAPTFVMTDNTASAKSMKLVVDGNFANFYESAGAAGDILTLDLTNKRVGIGTAAPSEKLHLLNSGAGATVTALVEGGATGAAWSRLILKAGTHDWRLFNYPVAASGFATDVLAIYDGTASQFRAVVDANGYLGVGTTAPARLVDVATTGFIRGKMQDYGGHVHNVLAYGAVADALWVSDGAMDNNVTFNLTCATSTPFTAADVGKPISVTGAGAAGAVLYTTITGFTSTSVVTLAAKNTSGAAISAKQVSWGTDNTTAFANADAAAVALYPLLGFGTVYVPRGAYRFSSTISVSARCALRGELDNPAYGQQGSILHFVAGSGSGTGTPAITLGEGSTIAGLLIVRPNQPITGNPIAFPFDIKMPAYSTAKEISFLGSYQGIDAASTTTGSYCSDVTIRGVYGDVAYIGIDIDRCYDTGHLADVHFYPTWTQDSTRMTWKHDNAIGVRFGRSDWQVCENIFTFGLGTGMQFNHSSAASGAGATSGTFSNVQIDSCKYGIDATETGYQGVQIAGLAVSGGGAGIDAYGIRTNYNASYKVNITVAGYEVWGTPLWGVYHDSLGLVTISNGQFIQQTGNNSFKGVYVGRDSAIIQGSQFRFDTAAYVALQSDTNALNVRFNGNVLNGCTLTISNANTTLDGSFPWPAASAYKAAAQNIPNAAATALTFDTNLYDNGVHSTSTNPTRFTAPTGLGTGLYSFVGQVTWAALAGGTSRQLQLWKNAATQVGQVAVPINGGAATTINLAWQGQLAGGDYLEIYAYQDSGGAANTVGGEANTRGSLTRLS